jgi:hypothetical protein
MTSTMTSTMSVELSADELLGSALIVALPERALMKHKKFHFHKSRRVSQSNSATVSNAGNGNVTINQSNDASGHGYGSVDQSNSATVSNAGNGNVTINQSNSIS